MGRLFIRRGIAGVKFDSVLMETAKRIGSAKIKMSKELDLTAENLKKLEEIGHLQQKELDFF